VTAKVSHAQNAEDIRVWRAFRGQDGPLRYVDVGANEPRYLSITASLHALGWSGLLIEADPELAALLRIHRPGDVVVQAAAGEARGEMTFYRVPGTGLGTTDPAEAEAARGRGFEVSEVLVQTLALDEILTEAGIGEVHFMSIDVEGAEASVLAGLSLTTFRPWVLCVEAVLPGTRVPSHQGWQDRILSRGYLFAAFDGVNRWYVAEEHQGLLPDIATPFNAIDAGEDGWVTAQAERDRSWITRSVARRAWQREVILNDLRAEIPVSEYLRQIEELRSRVVAAEGSRSWRYARRAGSLARGILARARASVYRLPRPVLRWLVTRRHLRHVNAVMVQQTAAGFLERAPSDVHSFCPVRWSSGDDLPEPPAIPLLPPNSQDVAHMRAWLDQGCYDTDEMLQRRVDHHDDEVGRTMAAVRLRMRLATSTTRRVADGSAVLVDVRCLQVPAFAGRGIGRFARAAVASVRASCGDAQVTLLVDRGLGDLPAEVAGSCHRVTRVLDEDVARYRALLQPSPMTASAGPLAPLLHSTAVKLAIVYDFIPLHHPQVYLSSVAARAEYAAALDALRCFDQVIAISEDTRREVESIIGRAGIATVAWPEGLADGPPAGGRLGSDGPIVIMTGDDARKNTFGGLAGTAVATVEESRDVVVLGMAGQPDRVHHWSIGAAMRPGECTCSGRLDDEQMANLLSKASVVVVPSFDEGLSLPVIEAVRAGIPVVASDIPAHRELLGAGTFLADPRSPRDLARAIRRTRGSRRTQRRQGRRLGDHRHSSLEGVIAERFGQRESSTAVRPDRGEASPAGAARSSTRPRIVRDRLDIAVAAPWTPQRTGVADFTRATIDELARLAQVTVYTTSDARPDGLPSFERLDGLLDRVAATGHHGHDVLISVIGNSHFHLPFLQLLSQTDAIALTHDTRLVELYLALRGPGGVIDLMLRGSDQAHLHPALDEQIADMRLLQSTALWEPARRAQALIAHTPVAADRITQETGVPVILLPFANQRRPDDVEPGQPAVTQAMRTQARKRLALSPDQVHLASFGFVDARAKCSDVVVEAAAWLQQWGHPIALHLVGSAMPGVAHALQEQARTAGLKHFNITGFVDEATLRDYALSVDLGIQLRISPMLGVSGPLSDLAAFGTPAVASRGLAEDVGAPGYIDRLGDDLSPVLVAEAVEYRLRHPWDPANLERMHRDYLEAKSPARYAQLLLAAIRSTLDQHRGAATR